MPLPRPDDTKVYTTDPLPPKPPVYPGMGQGPAGPPKPPKGGKPPYVPGQTAQPPANQIGPNNLLPPGVGLSGQGGQTSFPGYAPSAGSPIPQYIVRNGAYVINPAWMNMHGGGMPSNYQGWQDSFGSGGTYPGMGGPGPLPPDDYVDPRQIYMPSLSDLVSDRTGMTLLPELNTLYQPENVTDGKDDSLWYPSWTFPSYGGGGQSGRGGSSKPGNTRQRVAQRVLSWNIKE